MINFDNFSDYEWIEGLTKNDPDAIVSFFYKKNKGIFAHNLRKVFPYQVYGKFITINTNPYDWRTPQLNNLWNSGTESNPIKATNDPCPPGWRIPTYAELSELKFIVTKEWTTENGVWGFRLTDEFTGRYLFLPAAGSRDYLDGSLNTVGSDGLYCGSTPFSNNAYGLYFYSDYFSTGSYRRANGFSIRCVAE